MDRLTVRDDGKPLQIRSGHTPVNLGLMVGALGASIPAIVTEGLRSRAVDHVLPMWATYVFYAVLLGGSTLTLAGVWRQLPTELNAQNYRIIVRRLTLERIGHYAVAGIMICFATASLLGGGVAALSGAALLYGIGTGLVLRAFQTHVDLNKLELMLSRGGTTTGEWVRDPDGGDP
jgi:hypothetical protein